MSFEEYESQFLQTLAWLMIVSGGILGPFLTFTSWKVCYGRYASESWLYQISIPANIAWFLMELPTVLVSFTVLPYASAEVQQDGSANYLVIQMYLLHYLQRTFIYSFLIRGGKPTPVHSFLLGFLFSTWNGYMQSAWHLRHVTYSERHIYQPLSLLGLILFAAGFAINLHSDHILRNLRKRNETGYKIPRGGMFEYVSGANFLGEIMEWTGYALFAQSLPAFAFAWFTFMNTGPRALHHHKFYLQKFKNYPKSRKALIPFIL